MRAPVFVILRLVVACVASGFVSCARPAATRDPSRPLELLVTTDAETLDPRFTTDAVGLRVSRLLHAGLTRLDPQTSAPVPYLAESWRWDDPLTLRVTLRPGLRFHDSPRAPFESADVQATLAAFASPQVGSRHARIVEPIARVDTEGPLVVVIHLARAHATLLSDLELPILRRDQAARPAAAGDDLDGLGPYRLTARSPGDLHLEPTTGAAMDAHHALEIRTVHDENARALRLESGVADVAVNTVSPTLLPAFAGTPVQMVARPGANLTYLLTRSDEGPLADVRVRQAIALGIDRKLLAQTLLGGHATVAGSLFPPGHWAHPAAEVGAFTRDVGRARALLGEAGFAAGLALDLLTSTDRLRRSLATAMAQELEEIGVHVTVVPLELGTLLARLTAGDFQLGALQIPELAEPNVLRVFLDSASIPPNGAQPRPRARRRDRSPPRRGRSRRRARRPPAALRAARRASLRPPVDRALVARGSGRARVATRGSLRPEPGGSPARARFHSLSPRPRNRAGTLIFSRRRPYLSRCSLPRHST